MYQTFLIIVLFSTTTNKGLDEQYNLKVYTVDAIEINWRYSMKENRGLKIDFCQLIYWEWINGQDYNKNVPRIGWISNGYTMCDIKKVKNNGRTENSHEIKNDGNSAVCGPYKSNDYYYFIIRDEQHTIIIRTKTLIGGTSGTNTLFDPEAVDKNLRNGIRETPMSIHKRIMQQN